MATNRVLLGYHSGYNDYGLWISKPDKDVTTNLNRRDLIFDSRTSRSSNIAERVDWSVPDATSSLTTTTKPFSNTYSYIPFIVWTNTTAAGDFIQQGWRSYRNKGASGTRFDPNYTFWDYRRNHNKYRVAHDTNSISCQRMLGGSNSSPVYFSAYVFRIEVV